jgi:2-dehydropantoate 2-reductase
MHLNRRDARLNPIHFRSFQVLTQYSQLESQIWNQIYVCVPSTALTTELLEGIKTFGGSATIVKIQPGLKDRKRFTEHFEDSQIVSGMVSFMSYGAPLAGEIVAEPGMAYWFPPFLKSQFSGSDERVRGVVGALRAGGLPARAHPDVEALVGYVLAVEAPFVAGIEAAGWSFRQFRRSRYLHLASQGIKEASKVMAQYQPSRPPVFVKLANSLTIRLATRLLPLGSKVPLEPYLEHHFTKVRAQSLQHLDDYLDQNLKYDIEVSSLIELRNAIANGDEEA